MTDQSYFNIEIQPDLAVILTAEPESEKSKELLKTVREWPRRYQGTLMRKEIHGLVLPNIDFQSGYEKLHLLEDCRNLLISVFPFDEPLPNLGITVDTNINLITKTIKVNSIFDQVDTPPTDMEIIKRLELIAADKPDFIFRYQILVPDLSDSLKVETYLVPKLIPKEHEYIPVIVDALLLMSPREYDPKADWERPVNRDGEGNLKIALPHLGDTLNRIETYKERAISKWDEINPFLISKTHLAGDNAPEVKEELRRETEQYHKALRQHVENLTSE